MHIAIQTTLIASLLMLAFVLAEPPNQQVNNSEISSGGEERVGGVGLPNGRYQQGAEDQRYQGGQQGRGGGQRGREGGQLGRGGEQGRGGGQQGRGGGQLGRGGEQDRGGGGQQGREGGQQGRGGGQQGRGGQQSLGGPSRGQQRGGNKGQNRSSGGQNMSKQNRMRNGQRGNQQRGKKNKGQEPEESQAPPSLDHNYSNDAEYFSGQTNSPGRQGHRNAGPPMKSSTSFTEGTTMTPEGAR